MHRDLAARNVLVKDLNHLKITDFGLAKMIKWGANEKLEDGDDNMAKNCQTSETSAILKKHESTENFFSGNKQEKLPLAWLAPECLKSQIFSHKSDVYAYGVTVWEILTFGMGRPWKGYQSWAGYHNNTKWYQYQPYNLTVFSTLLAKHNTTTQHLCLQLVTTLMSGCCINLSVGGPILIKNYHFDHEIPKKKIVF